MASENPRITLREGWFFPIFQSRCAEEHRIVPKGILEVLTKWKEGDDRFRERKRQIGAGVL